MIEWGMQSLEAKFIGKVLKVLTRLNSFDTFNGKKLYYR